MNRFDNRFQSAPYIIPNIQPIQFHAYEVNGYELNQKKSFLKSFLF